MEHTIDADGKSLGRVASATASVLRGKTSPMFARERLLEKTSVVVINAGKVRLTGTKKASKVYKRYSGYPGGFSTLSFADMISRHGYDGVFRKAIERMLPANKLRPLLMKRLTIKE